MPWSASPELRCAHDGHRFCELFLAACRRARAAPAAGPADGPTGGSTTWRACRCRAGSTTREPPVARRGDDGVWHLGVDAFVAAAAGQRRAARVPDAQGHGAPGGRADRARRRPDAGLPGRAARSSPPTRACASASTGSTARPLRPRLAVRGALAGDAAPCRLVGRRGLRSARGRAAREWMGREVRRVTELGARADPPERTASARRRRRTLLGRPPGAPRSRRDPAPLRGAFPDRRLPEAHHDPTRPDRLRCRPAARARRRLAGSSAPCCTRAPSSRCASATRSTRPSRRASPARTATRSGATAASRASRRSRPAPSCHAEPQGDSAAEKRWSRSTSSRGARSRGASTRASRTTSTSRTRCTSSARRSPASAATARTARRDSLRPFEDEPRQRLQPRHLGARRSRGSARRRWQGMKMSDCERCHARTAGAHILPRLPQIGAPSDAPSLDATSCLGLGGGAAGVALTPVPWKLLDDVSIWTQHRRALPVPPRGRGPLPSRRLHAVPRRLRAARALRRRRARCRSSPSASHPLGRGACALGLTLHHLACHPLRLASPAARSTAGSQPSTLDAAVAALAAAVGRRADERRQSVMVLDRRPGRVVSQRLARAARARLPNGVYATSPARRATLAALAGGAPEPARSGIDLERTRTLLSFGAPVLDGWGRPGRMLARAAPGCASCRSTPGARRPRRSPTSGCRRARRGGSARAGAGARAR